jgi:Fe-S-cluster-containing dehydrogenase component/CRP-like cAMP-binding protein
MPREIQNHEQIIEAFRKIDIVSELVEQLPNGEFRNELDMDIILFGRSYRNHKVGPYARLLEFAPGETIVEGNTWESSIFFVLVTGKLEAFTGDGPANLKKVGEVPEGNSFGEMAVLAGTRRNATVKVAEGEAPAMVLEFMRPALRLLRKLSRFGKALDRNYRAYGLALTINELRDYTHAQFDAGLLQRLDDAARFAIYEKDHVIFHEGDPINRIVFLRNGWLQRVSGADFNPRAADVLMRANEAVGMDFLGAGSCLGLDAIEAPTEWKYTATVRGRAEVIEISVSRLREEKALCDVIVPALLSSMGRETAVQPQKPEDARALYAAGKEIETGIVDSVNLLVMDMAKCIRCGNCSLACHKVHGHSRLVRRGIHIERPKKNNALVTQSVLAPKVCLHCQDPECLTGCPTGAIARFPNGEIDINPSTCIGCGDCATQCPYDAISMIPRPGGKSAKKPETNGVGSTLDRITNIFSLRQTELPPPVTATEDLLAVKCNLCQDTGMNPKGKKRAAYSCEENCPTGALVRVNPREYFTEAGNTIGLIHKSKTHAIGENIHKKDTWARIWHTFGTLLVVAGAASAIWATMAYTQDAPLMPGSWLTMRWVTGLSGLASIVWVMAYPARKQIYRRRAGALRYWMLTHIYIGVLAGLLILVHGGTSSGGLLTSLLMISFDLVIASGLLGIACYLAVPRLMTRIEREPLLLEDLEARREELRTYLIDISEYTESERLHKLIQSKVRTHFLTLSFLLRQYFLREDLKTMHASARADFRSEAEGLTRIEEARLMEAVETASTLRRIDALIYLHRSLKIWVAPHVLFTAIMLVLMMAHIVQAIYFNVR